MGLLANVLVGFIPGLAGLVVGRTWPMIRVRLVRRLPRRFWRPFLQRKPLVVVSRFHLPSFHEPTGVIGGGDQLAHDQLRIIFEEIGLRKFDLRYVEQEGLDRSRNLVLLGGPGTNSVTADAMRLAGSTLRIVDPGPDLPMEIKEVSEDPSAALIDEGDDRKFVTRHVAEAPTRRDYGVIVRAPNPFSYTSTIVWVAGCYGYGTWGGVMLLRDSAFLRQCEEMATRADPDTTDARQDQPRTNLWPHWQRSRRRWGAVECVYSVDVYDNRPHKPTVLALRPIVSS